MMFAAGCTEEREIKPGTKRPKGIRKQFKGTITPHYFRDNYVTLLYEAGIYTYLKEGAPPKGRNGSLGRQRV